MNIKDKRDQIEQLLISEAIPKGLIVSPTNAIFVIDAELVEQDKTDPNKLEIRMQVMQAPVMSEKSETGARLRTAVRTVLQNYIDRLPQDAGEIQQVVIDENANNSNYN